MKQSNTKAMVWTGRIITILCVLFLVVDAGMKIVKARPSMEGSVQLGWPENAVQLIGIILMVFTVMYTIPRTAVLGAILLTAYLGGATAIMLRAETGYFFPVVFGVLVWAGLYFRNETLRAIVPLGKNG